MNDAEFEAYIARRSRLSRRYQDLSADFPPKALDDAVLGRARSAIALDRKETPEREVYIRWMAPVAFAATVVLVFTVVLQIVIRPAGAPEPLADKPATMDSNASPAAATPDQAPQLANESRRSDKIDTAAPAAGKRLSAVPAAPPGPVRLERARDEATPAAEKKAEASQSGVVANDAEKSRTARQNVEADRSPVTVTVTESRRAMEAMQSVPSMPRPLLEEERRDPQIWLAYIQKLRKGGQAAAADAEMKLFLEKFPDYFRTHPLPDDAR
jgi:hypothetical protein